jgi:hypothetical protein
MAAVSNCYRSFVIKLPIPWYAKPKILTADKISKYIAFINEGNEVNAIQTTMEYNFDAIAKGCSPKLTYLYSRNKVSIELNNPIFKEKYRLQDPKRFRIEKDRYMLPDFDRCCLDIYKNKLIGLGILRCGLDRYYDTIVVPHYFDYVKDITNDKRFLTYNLSSIKSIAELDI